ncbi:bacterial Ig-like domain-containing protein [Listeria monocytogenes]|nr:LPXTG cell wall anchor domain-containing protein [Listeria monocytogenes]
MTKARGIQRYFILLLTICVVLSQLNLASFHALAAEKGNESLSYDVQQTLSADKKKATLTMKVTPKNEQVTILSVETPDGKKTDGAEAAYTAEANKSVDFLITYQTKDDHNQTTTNTFEASYEVTGIASEETVTSPADEKVAEKSASTEKQDVATKEDNTSQKSPVKGLKATPPTATLSIPDYNQTAWSNGDIKDVTVTVDFGNDTSSGKKVNFTLPDGMRFMSIPVPSEYQATSGVDATLLTYLGSSNPLGTAITSTTVPSKETTYNSATFGTVSYAFKEGTEKASFTFSIRVDAAKYYGATDLKAPIQVEAFMDGASTPVASAEQKIHAEGNKVVGYANQDHVKTMFRNWFSSYNVPEVMASTDTDPSYNDTKTYAVVTGLNQVDSRGATIYLAKHSSLTLYYPEGMDYVGVTNGDGRLMGNNSYTTITPYPEEHKVVIDIDQSKYNGAPRYGVRYQIPKGTPAGTYNATKAPHAVITTYDGEVFESDALTSNGANLTTVAPVDTVNVVDTTLNKMAITTGNKNINPDNETWAGSIQVNNKKTAGTKTNQIYHIQFDPNWKVYTVNLPFDGTIPNNKVTDIQYKTNLDNTYRTYTGTLPTLGTNRMASFDATAVGLQEGEYFTDVKANVGDFSPGYESISPNNTYIAASTASYGIVSPGITSVQFKAEMYDATDEANTKVSGVSTYSVSNNITTVANGTATYYNSKGSQIKAASAGDKVTTKASLAVHEYPYGTRTALNDPVIYLRAVEGSAILPASIKLMDQNNQAVNYTVQQETANNGDKVYVLKTTDVTVGRYVDYPSKYKYLNLSYDTTFDVTLDKNISMDIQNVLAWGGPDVTSYTTTNCFSDVGLDVNKNGKDNENLLSANSSTLSVSKQDTVAVETFLSVAGEGAKSPYVDGDDSTVSYFTPGTNADYTVKVTNTSDSAANTFELYIPIPKTGEDFGTKFQNDPFKWDMKLSQALTLTPAQQAQFDVSYATTATADNYESASIYTSTVADYGQVNMVKIKVKTQINAGEEQNFQVPLQVDETFDSATTGDKIGERDIYNPYYRVVTNTFSGTLAGTKVGAELVIAEVSGRLFNDKDANGLYEVAKGDTVLANETVELYKWNDTTSQYEPAKQDGNPVTAKTDANGLYKFDYTTGVAYGKYAVKFPDKAGYEFTLKNVGKDSTIDSDVPNTGADKGWVKEIDPTQPDAASINAGYFQYTAADLKVNLNEKLVREGASLKVTLPKVASTSSLPVEDTIEPAFFNNIQASVDGMKWTSADTSKATVQTLSDGSGAIVGVSAQGKTVSATNVTIAIQDMFGAKQSSTAPVYVATTDGKVTQKDSFTLGATDFSLEYKASVGLTDEQALNLAKTAAFEEVKNGVNSNAQDLSSTVQVNEDQLSAIQNGSKQGGTYPLTFTITKDGKTADVVIQVTVAKDLTEVNAHDSTIYVGDSWTAADNFNSALDKEGTSVNFSAIQVTGTVNTQTAGTYPVTYTYNGVSTTVQVTVKDVQTAVNAHDSVIYTGDSWTAADNFDSAVDKDGRPIALKDVTVTGTVNTKQAGNYMITYTYDGVSTSITVTVKEDKEGVQAHDSTIYVGDTWSAEDNFDSAFDKDGKPVTFQAVKVVEKPTVNTKQAGTYEVTYSYGNVSKTVTLTVKEVQTAVNAHDSTIYVGDSWSAADNFDSARDKDGQPVALSDVQVTGTVDTKQAGIYAITYSYDGVSVTVHVIVKDPQTAVHAHDSVIYAGDKWDAADNFDSAVDKDGKQVAYKDLTVSEMPTVDTHTPGVYQVTYSYDGISTTINVTVEPRQTNVEVHDSTIYAGDKWSPKDNFDQAKDKQGNVVPFADVTVTGNVDTKTPGTYEVSYVYDGVKEIAHITVLPNQAHITVQDSTIHKGDAWKAQDNFIQATNRDGKIISFFNVQTKGTVNSHKVGSYEVAYTIDPNEGTADAGKEQITVTATITVVDSAKPVVPSKPTTPTKPTTNKPSTGGTTIHIQSSPQHTATYLEAKPLPKTGDQTSPWVLWAGFSLVGLGMVLIFTKRRREYK